MRKISYFIQESWLLITCSFCFGLLIAVTNAALAPKIEQNKTDKLNALTKNLLPTAKHFAAVDGDIEIELSGGKKEKVRVYKAISETEQCVGWSFNTSGEGFAGKIELIVAVEPNFDKIAGFDVLVSSETPGFGDRIKTSSFRSQFAGAPADTLNLVKTGDRAAIDSEIIAITGATISSQAVVNIFNNYLPRIKVQMAQKGLITDGK